MSSWSFLCWFLLCHIKACLTPPHPLMGSEDFHMTRRSHLWVFPHTHKTMGRVPREFGPRTRSLPEGMLSHTCPTYAVTLCTCEDFSEDAVVKSPPPHSQIMSLLFTMFLQPSALMLSPGKEGVGRTFQYRSDIKYCKCRDQFKSISTAGCGLCGCDTSVGIRCWKQLFHYRDHQHLHLHIPAGDT